jgi:hypothetical protein
VSSAAPARKRNVDVTLLALAVLLVAVLSYQVVRRVLFPWDLLMWSESPFMTNMLKLTLGQAVYSDPADVNAFVYSPGLEYVSFALLRPLGLQLDVRACRVVVVALGALACGSAARVGAGLLASLGSARRSRLVFLGFGATTCAAVLGKNFTADVCHPDNLLMAHMTVSLALGAWALKSARPAHALVAVAFASLAVFAKQTGAGAGGAMAAGLLLAEPAFRRRWVIASLASAALLVTGLALATLLVPAHARFWVLEVPSAHRLEVWKIQVLIRQDIIGVPHRLLLLALVPFAFVWLRLRRETFPARLALLWLCLGLAGVLPILSAYFKEMGGWNNLGVVDLWASVLVLPVLWQHVITLLERTESPPTAAALPVGALVLLLLTTPPTRLPPTPAHWEYCRLLDRKIQEAVGRGERVLLAHGAMPLLRAGLREVPRDRANSALELVYARQSGKMGMGARLEQRRYDRIFVNGTLGWYGPMQATIQKSYKVVETILASGALPGARGTEGLDVDYGYQSGGLLLNTPMQIMAPVKPAKLK